MQAAATSRPGASNRSAQTQKPVSAGNAAPREREPEVVVEAAAEQLEVVGEHEEGAREDERDQRRRDGDRPGDPDRAARRRGRAAASAISVRSESAVRSGRPFSSSSACAPTPTARKNAPSAAPRRPRSKRYAAAAPSAT